MISVRVSGMTMSLLIRSVTWFSILCVCARGAELPRMVTPDDWRQSVKSELQENILPFWIKQTVDRERGGFYGEISNNSVVKKDAPRGALLTCRILWTYSAAYRKFHDPAFLEMAKWAYDDLNNRFWDRENGGLFWSVDMSDSSKNSARGLGRALPAGKQIYGQAFGVYSLSEYYLASGDHAALDRAIAIYRLIESHAHDQNFGGYWEVFTPDWQRETDTRRSTVAHSATKSQNTHLHILEAYTNLLRAWPDPDLRKNQLALVDVMITKILNPRTHHLILFQKDDWTAVTDDISYGHDIEFSWLIVEAGDVLGDPVLMKKLQEVSLEVAQVTLAEGFAADGSLPYEASPTGVTNSYREWWPQAEAAVGFYNAYQLSGDKRFATAALKAWNYIESQLVDHQNGEWFAGRMADGSISRAPKVSLWKCPYHNGRSCMELLARFDEKSGTTASMDSKSKL